MVNRRKRPSPPRPPDPPAGWMWWHGDLTKIVDVERLAKKIIGNHDNLPRHLRDSANGIVRHYACQHGKANVNCHGRLDH